MSHCLQRVDTFNVPIPSSHYGPPYVFTWTTFLFFFQLHTFTMHAKCKTRETQMPGRLEGGQAPTRRTVQGFVSARHFHLSRSNKGLQHLVSETACQSNPDDLCAIICNSPLVIANIKSFKKSHIIL